MPPRDPDAPGTATTVHVRGAIAGDRESLGWIVTRSSPLLRAQAVWRLGTTILNLVNNRIKAAVKQRRRTAPPSKPELEIDPVDELAATVTGASTAAARGEIGSRLDACLAALPERLEGAQTLARDPSHGPVPFPFPSFAGSVRPTS